MERGISKLSEEEKQMIKQHRDEKEHQEFINQFKFRIRAMYNDSQSIHYYIFNIEELLDKKDFLRSYTILAIDRFSGYKYSDGKDIFEEDIVYDADTSCIGKITFDWGCFNVSMPNEDGTSDCELLEDMVQCIEFKEISYDNPKWDKTKKQEGH